MTDYPALYRKHTAALRERAARPASDDLGAYALAALIECFDSGRPFMWLRSVDAVDRIRLRDAWESVKRARAWRSDAIAQYRQIRHALTGRTVDTIA